MLFLFKNKYKQHYFRSENFKILTFKLRKVSFGSPLTVNVLVYNAGLCGLDISSDQPEELCKLKW